VFFEQTKEFIDPVPGLTQLDMLAEMLVVFVNFADSVNNVACCAF
jgi:hypothetical protein